MKTNIEIIKNYLNQCDPIEILSYSEVKVIKDLIVRDNYVQIIIDFGINKVLCILNILEEREEYKKCAKLLKQINSYNKTRGTDYKTHL